MSWTYSIFLFKALQQLKMCGYIHKESGVVHQAFYLKRWASTPVNLDKSGTTPLEPYRDRKRYNQVSVNLFNS